eukprot:TRINITY_DN32657_c0_g1_i1.p2 TRINITY_DN32657_c0_g1~~TRINITY_DN32657_c0_g1_i1.p2  ORF type:complete len:312 (-),score=89.65 TRINITY_DN32657_c0_g1_i1:115-1050(-)
MAPIDECEVAVEAPLLFLRGASASASSDEVLATLELQEPSSFGGLDASRLSFALSDDFVRRALDFCDAVAIARRKSSEGGACLRLAHNELGSGTELEQRTFELRAERELREKEKAFFQQKKRESSKQKDFASSAKMRREGEEGTAVAESRLDAIDEELAQLERRRETVPWSILCKCMQTRTRNFVSKLDLTNCGLHATALVSLTQIMLDLEHRADGVPVSWLILDGNDLGDIASVALAAFVRLSGAASALSLRNIGFTDQGLSEVAASLVTNKKLALLDLRNNGLCSDKVVSEVITGIRRFNSFTEILHGN